MEATARKTYRFCYYDDADDDDTAGNVAGMGQKRWEFNNFIGKHEGKRRIGKPKRISE
jgi:hypothetical protein